MGAAKQFKIIIPVSTKMILTFLFLALILIAAQSYIDFTTSKVDLEARILSDLNAIAQTKATAIKTLVEEDFEDTLDTAGRVALKAAIEDLARGSKDPAQSKAIALASLMSSKESIKAIKDIDILDLKGKVLVSTIQENENKDLSKDACFLHGKNGLYLCDPYMGKDTFVYDMSAPIYSYSDGKKEEIAVAKVKIDTTRLYDILNDYTGLGNTGESVLARRIDSEIIFIGPLRHRNAKEPQLHIPLSAMLAKPIQMALRKKSGIITDIDYRGKTVLAAYRYIPMSNWGLAVKIDVEEAFRPIRDLLMRIIAASLILFIISIVTVILISRRVTRPIKSLSAATKELAAGNLDYRVKVDTKDEIGLLATSFNDMAASLKEITVSHDTLYKEIEERRRVEKELYRAIKAKTDFTSMVSHELRTPLAAIKEGISIVIDGIVGKITDEQRSFLGIARMNVDRLTRLINDILDFQKLEAGKMDLNIKENDIVAVLDEVYRTMRTLTEDKGIFFKVRVEGTLPRIMFDRDKIIQVLTNLVNNAIKFTLKGGIEIIACMDKGHIHVMVRDSGIGIKEEDMPRLFKSFEQLEIAVETRGGTGLGLAISKEIIERHHGRIWARSEYGKGTTVYFTLPVRKGHEAP